MVRRLTKNNQVFVGLPWQNVKKKYEQAIVKLEKRYALHFTIVGRNDGQDAVNLFETIKQRIATSIEAVFDATGGNPNVSLEYGYAEGIGLKKSIFVSAHKSSGKLSAGSPIISDLAGQRRVQYKNERSLFAELEKFCKGHDFSKRFDTALKKTFGKKSRHVKKSMRSLALKAIHMMDDRPIIKRNEMVQHLDAQGYDQRAVEDVLRGLHKHKVILCAVGRYSDVRIR